MKDPINTLQELERNSKTPTDGCAPTLMHTAEWLAAFGAQATQRTIDAVAAHVAKRATWIRAQQGDAAPHVINAMVSDALGDTFADVVTWNPLRCSLALHLKSVIRSRLSHELEHNEDHPHVDIETASEHEVNEALLNGGRTTPTKQLGRYVKEFTSRLRAAAADDLAVLTLIDLHLQDITERGQICHITGMKPGAYHNAFRRLKRLAEKLPEELRAAAVEELAGTVADAGGYSELSPGFQSFQSPPSASRHSPAPIFRSATRANVGSVASRIAKGTSRPSSFGTLGPAPANNSQYSSSQRHASVIRAPRSASRFLIASDVRGTG